jgi:chemotaxis protein histidine kinase CheA
MSRALLALEKEPGEADSIDLIFRMAHGIKGMAASLEYASLTKVAHALEDRMAAIRTRGSAIPGGEMALLFRGLETLESMVAVVRETGDAPPIDHPQAQSFCAANEALTESAVPETSKKKALNPSRNRVSAMSRHPAPPALPHPDR